MKGPSGLCSWSLHNDVTRVSEVMGAAGLSHLHLAVSALAAFEPIIHEKAWSISAMMIGFPQEDYSTLESIKETGGILPDECWPRNRQRVLRAIKATAERGVPYLTTHAGFMDHTNPSSYMSFCNRIRELADAAIDQGIMLLMETGQETAEDLRRFLETLHHPALGVNFDPANMILYGKGDPIEAVRTLSPWIKHVHIKDAVAARTPGEWGREVPWGDGDVGAENFLSVLQEIGYEGATVIEREQGEQREADIVAAARRMEAYI